MQIQSICKRCSIILREFAKRAQTTFRAFAKGNLLPFGMSLPKAKRLPFYDYKDFISVSLSSF
jgi:hypothetical protein